MARLQKVKIIKEKNKQTIKENIIFDLILKNNLYKEYYLDESKESCDKISTLLQGTIKQHQDNYYYFETDTYIIDVVFWNYANRLLETYSDNNFNHKYITYNWLINNRNKFIFTKKEYNNIFND